MIKLKITKSVKFMSEQNTARKVTIMLRRDSCPKSPKEVIQGWG